MEGPTPALREQMQGLWGMGRAKRDQKSQARDPTTLLYFPDFLSAPAHRDLEATRRGSAQLPASVHLRLQDLAPVCGLSRMPRHPTEKRSPQGAAGYTFQRKQRFPLSGVSYGPKGSGGGAPKKRC